jgi:VWFA-related protein
VIVVLALASLRPAVPEAVQASREGTLFVSAVDSAGEPVEGLGPEAFIVREDDVRREVLRVSRANEPMDVAILVDNSTAATDQITFLRSSVSKFATRMAPGNQVAIVALADRPTILVDYTDDSRRLEGAVGRLFALPQSGMTLLDAIFETSQGLAKRETPRAVIVPVVTDGIEFTNRYSKDVVRALKDVDAALHIVGIGQFYHSQDHPTRERSFLLDEGPRESGGQQRTLLSPHALDSALQRLARELLSQYKVVYARPESLIAPERTIVSSARPEITMRGAPARRAAGG